jgi:acyl carrier protein
MPQRVLINLYGSSEVAADVTWYDATHCVEKVPIGRPIANTQIYLLDRNLQPVPIGIPGEIYVGGDGLAQGYLNRPDLTSEKFISNPFGQEKLDFLGNSHQKVLFKTGDIGCYLPDGNIEFLGRGDCQVKIRGFRIELGEIEAALSQHSSVSTAAVLLQENEPGSQRLVAYLVPNSGFRNQYPELISELRSFLKHKLPDYMVPSAFVLLDALPLTPNGKIDRLALSQRCDYVSDETAFTEPQTPTEEEIAEIWTALLGLEKVGTNQNFFDLGGHSLMATQLILRVRSCFGVELALCDFFAAPTIQNLAELVEEEILANADSNQIDELLDLLEKSDGESAQTVMLTE